MVHLVLKVSRGQAPVEVLLIDLNRLLVSRHHVRLSKGNVVPDQPDRGNIKSILCVLTCFRVSLGHSCAQRN